MMSEQLSFDLINDDTARRAAFESAHRIVLEGFHVEAEKVDKIVQALREAIDYAEVFSDEETIALCYELSAALAVNRLRLAVNTDDEPPSQRSQFKSNNP